MWRGYLHRVQHKIFSFQPSQNPDDIAITNVSYSEIGASTLSKRSKVLDKERTEAFSCMM
jgi:hypothetical protein